MLSSQCVSEDPFSRSSYQPRGPKRAPAVASTFIYRAVGLRRAVVSSELVLLTLVGRTFRLCRPSTCALIIADSILLVKGFQEIFCPSRFSCPQGPLRGLADQTLGHSASIRPLFIGALLLAIPRWRRPDASFTDLPSHRALLGWSSDPVGIIPFRWSYCITLQRGCQRFWEISLKVF